ncbi:MAG: DNA polymerase III subunit gamma/tau, partial [Firmicutes bacterium]|nr:DNA polymerase III subunit gamma/tau [Bacillota bacterium]
MYTALYRAERPEVFDEILGQEHIVKILRHQIASDTVGHAYLFCGTRGTGKTTTARILAKGVNCTSPDVEGRPCGECANCKAISQGNFMDVIEIDAASNNGVENIRELRESVKYPPAIGRRKVYIIDEVHMLSTGAFNALLKTLEEPPENVMFILATTEPQKLPATILSRCLKFDFKRVPQSLIMDGMKRICSDRGVEISDGALRLVANCADGSVRDGLSILDQVLASGEKNISREDVLEYIGTAGEDFFIELTEKVSLRNVSEALLLVDEALADGKDVRSLMRDWTAYYRNLMIAKFVKNPEDLLNMSAENILRIKQQGDHISMDEINDAILKLSKAINEARWSTQPRILLELALVNIASGVSETAAPKQETRRAPARPAMQPAQAKPVMQPASPRPAEPVQTIQTSENKENEMLWHQVFEEGEDEA